MRRYGCGDGIAVESSSSRESEKCGVLLGEFDTEHEQPLAKSEVIGRARGATIGFGYEYEFRGRERSIGFSEALIGFVRAYTF